MVEEAHMTHPRLAPVPVYVTPGKVVLTTVGCAVGISATFFAAWHLAARATWRCLNEHRKYGRPQRT
jgi:hypothetical protein